MGARASVISEAMSDVERLALRVDASIRRRGASATTIRGAEGDGVAPKVGKGWVLKLRQCDAFAFASLEGEGWGIRNWSKRALTAITRERFRAQLDVEFGGLEMNTLDDEKFMLQNMYDEFDDSVIGVESRENTPERGAGRHGSGTGKRSSTTGASVEWTKGFTKTLKNFDVDSPRVGTRSARRVSYQGSASTNAMETPAAKAPNSRRSSGANKLSPPQSAASARTTLNAGVFDSACRPVTPESKKCNCKKSKCLKLYCECFAAGAFCKDCSCLTCQNTVDNKTMVEKTRQNIESRNPNAFASKIMDDEEADEARHTKGCHCKKSACLKKYCECFQAGVKCQDYCKCDGCKNKDEGVTPGPKSGSAKKSAGASAIAAATSASKSGSRSRKTAVKETSIAAAYTAKMLQEELVIEDFKFDKLGSPIRSPMRSFDQADDFTSEYSTMNNKSMDQSPLRTLLLSEGISLSPLFTNNNGMLTGVMSPLRVGQMSPLRSSVMSPFTPSMRAGKFSARPRGAKVPVPLFNDESGGEFKTPRDVKTNGLFGGKHDGRVRPSFTSPIPLSTPDVFE